MSYIDLNLKKLEKEEVKLYKISDAINEFNIIVILGAPGSGKTSILEKYANENSVDTQFISVKKFIKLNTEVKDTTTALLLDGLDEYRSVSEDKTFVLSELGDKINKLYSKNVNLKVVISCREMDWYGESDKNALKDEIKQVATLFSVLPLSIEQQNELAELLSVANKDVFIDKFSNKGFLDNPQMFYMLSEIWKLDKDVINSKVLLYKKFILNAREHNINHQKNTSIIEQEDMFKYIGYFAFYYMFSGIDEFGANLIDKVVSVENEYTRESLEAVLKTKIFKEGKFIHRTIAEYALANYILNYKLSGVFHIDKERVKDLFVKNGRVPTELRGTYAWMCSLSEDEEFIKVDPYYQAIHGDNSLFNFEEKKKIVLAVKEYSIKNPYFFEFNQKMELEGFYTSELDDFLIEEYDKALVLKNHYVFFIVNIIIQGKKLSDKIKEFMKETLIDNNIPAYYKDDFIKSLKEENKYLEEILDKIKSDELEDEHDNLKENILRLLYPKYISHLEVAKYLNLYKSEVGGYCYYLNNTDYKDKFALVDEIYKVGFDTKKEPYLNLPKNVDYFIKDYLLETLLEYKESLDAEKIYEIIKHFKRYYRWYDNLKFESFRYKITDKLKLSDEKMQSLANELFELYIDEMITSGNKRFRIYNFNYFFNYKYPNNQSKVLLGKLNKTLDRDLNLELFLAGLNYLPRDENTIQKIPEIVDKLVKEYAFEEEYNNWKYPKKHSWEVESEEREQKRIQEEIEIKQKNEQYFKDKKDEDIQKSFGDLNWIANLFYLDNSDKSDKYLESETLKRLAGILKNSICSELIDPELLTIESLAKNSPNAHRNIDTVYYVSLVLNNEDELLIIDKSFVKYLYINALHHENIGNVQKSNFSNKLEQIDIGFVKNLLKEYISLLVNEYNIEISKVVGEYIDKDDNFKNLKNLAMSYSSSLSDIKNSLINSFLHAYGFRIKEEDLTTLNSLDVNADNKNSIEALLVFHKDDKDKFTINMAIAFHELIKDNREELYDRFKSFDSALKVKIISYMMTVFSTEDSIKYANGIQSSKNICADFLTSFSLMLLNLDELNKLSNFHAAKDNIWKYKILNKISELTQLESDQSHGRYSIEDIKLFIFNNLILSTEDFFIDIYLKIESLKKEIEDNRKNDKDAFYSQIKGVKSKKTEEACRDIILQRLSDKYSSELDFTKELYEANNRVDINIRYLEDLSYEVQVECKRDDNSDLYKGIQNQLIDKYFSSGVQHGVYLIFYFRDLKNKALILEKVYKSLPEQYSDKIKIVCIDLGLEKDES